MLELAFDASAKSAGVCIIKDERDLKSMSIDNGSTHSEELMKLMDRLFISEKVDISEVKKIYVANGPGSFTGVRIAMSIAKGLAHALNIPLYPVSTLDALSYHGKNHKGLICPIMDARRQRVYTGLYRGFGGERLLEASALKFEDLLLELKKYNESILFVGDGLQRYEKEISEIKDLELAKVDEGFVLANSEGVYMAAKAYDYKPATYQEALPLYLRKAQAERERDAKRICNNKTCTE